MRTDQEREKKAISHFRIHVFTRLLEDSFEKEKRLCWIMIYLVSAVLHRNGCCDSQECEQNMIKTKRDILKVLEQNQSSLRALGVKKIGLFGSFVRGEQRPDSDIDLLVEFEPGQKTFDAFMELCFFLDEILQHRTELVSTESLSPYLGPHILRGVEYAGLAA